MVEAFYLARPGEAGGRSTRIDGRDPVVKIYTTITDRYAPLHQTVIAGTVGEAIHALDGILGHDSNADLTALRVDGGGVSDIVFATMRTCLGSISSRASPPVRSTPLRLLNPEALWQASHRCSDTGSTGPDRQPLADIERVIGAMRDRTRHAIVDLEESRPPTASATALLRRCARSGGSRPPRCSRCAGSTIRFCAAPIPPS
ncbi:Tn3 family transposase [Sphingomonas aerolata]|uniref:Tn3 family transposase n=1 Tax=Sphingomonas aerolata TaxID=185951 RepID=UPI002FE12F72